MHGHILKLAEAEGRASRMPAARSTFTRMLQSIALFSWAQMTITFRFAETLFKEVPSKMHAPAKSNYPVVTPETLTKYNAVLFGFPTRYGNFSAQWKVFWDHAGN